MEPAATRAEVCGRVGFDDAPSIATSTARPPRAIKSFSFRPLHRSAPRAAIARAHRVVNRLARRPVPAIRRLSQPSVPHALTPRRRRRSTLQYLQHHLWRVQTETRRAIPPLHAR